MARLYNAAVRTRFIAGAITAAALTAGIIMRIAATRHELWLDEIWSIELMQTMRGPLDIFTLHHDNNHYLNTLWLWLLGPSRDYWIYRIPSLLSGVTLILLMTTYCWRKDPWAGTSIAVLLSVSVLFVKVSAEARGYAPMLLFAWLSYRAMENFIMTRKPVSGLLFGICACIAFLWQLTYCFLFAGLVAWSLHVFWHGKRPADAWVFLPPIALLNFLLLTDITQWTIGGGPRLNALHKVMQFPATLFGLPYDEPVLTLGASAIAVALVITAVLRMRRSDPGKAILYAVTLFAAPIIVLLLLRPQYVPPRYFMASYLLLFMLAASAAGGLMRGMRAEKAAYVLFLALFTAGNIPLLMELLRSGSGGYASAVMYIMERDSHPVIAGDTGIRIEKPLRFYAERIRHNAEVKFVGKAEDAPWLLREKAAYTADEPAAITWNGASYDLVPSASGDGQFWALYERRVSATINP